MKTACLTLYIVDLKPIGCGDRASCIEVILVLALDALVKYGLAFVSRAQLHGVKVHFAVIAFGAFLLDLKNREFEVN